MTDHVITVGDDFAIQPEVVGKAVQQMKDPTTLWGANQKAQLAAATARQIDLGAYIRDGVLNTIDNPFGFSKSATGLTFQIGLGKAVVQPYVISTPTQNVSVTTVTAARYDIVCALSSDTIAGSLSSGFTTDSIIVVRGSNQADPPIPARAIPLWRIRLPANAATFDTSVVDDLRKWTAPPGGVVKIAGSSQAVGLPTGTPVFDTALGGTRIVNNRGTLSDIGPRMGLIDRNYGTPGARVPSGGVYIDPAPTNVFAPKDSWVRMDVQAMFYVDGAGQQTTQVGLNFPQIAKSSDQSSTTWPQIHQILEPEFELDNATRPFGVFWRHYLHRTYVYKTLEDSTADVRFAALAGLGPSLLVQQVQINITIYPLLG